jgi:hypothetical protein
VSDAIRDDIRTTSHEIAAHAEQLADLERQKQDPEANDEDLQQLAAETEGLALRITELTRIEKKLVERATKG